MIVLVPLLLLVSPAALSSLSAGGGSGSSSSPGVRGVVGAAPGAVPPPAPPAVSPAAPADVYGLNGTVGYTLYAENFAGRCWGERVSAAITHAIQYGNGSGIVQLPPGDLNVSTPIRFARTARGDPCAQLNATRSLATVWGCNHGATQADLPRGLTLLGTGGTSGDVSLFTASGFHA